MVEGTDTNEDVVGQEQVQETQVGQEAQEQAGFDFSSINDQYKDIIGENPLDEGSLKNLIDNRNRAVEYEEQIKTKDEEIQGAMEFKSKYESLISSIDPEKLAPNKEALALSQLADKYKGTDAGVLSKIRGTDLSEMSHLEGLVLAAKMATKTNLPDSAIKGEILRGLGIDVESLDELSDSEKFRIEREFSKEKGALEEIKGFQPEGIDFDFEGEIKSLQEKKTQDRVSLETHNKESLDILFDSYKEVKTIVKDAKGDDVELSYTVDPKFKDSFFEEALKDLTDSGLKITTQNANEVASQIDQAYKNANFNNILQDAIKQMGSRQKEATHNELHNDSATNQTEAPTITSKQNVTLKESFRTRKNK
jgi:uncharacterized protein YutD